jgi:hypothetical protein
VTAFLNADRLAKDIARINDARAASRGCRDGRQPGAAAQLQSVQIAHAFQAERPDRQVRQVLRHDDQGAEGRLRQGDGRPHHGRHRPSAADRWNFLFIAGMWFQDLFNYDFRRTEQCIIPYATQEGEISFCAYNTGVGWRNIIEKMHMTATLTKWYEEQGPA